MKIKIAFAVILVILFSGYFLFQEETDYHLFGDGSFCWNDDLEKGVCSKGDLKKEITEEGEGVVADKGDTVFVHYRGTLLSGEEFDSSTSPFSFKLGEGRVIQGWEQGVRGMREGEKAVITIAPELAYGDHGVGSIPPGSTLVFEIEVLSIEK